MGQMRAYGTSVLASKQISEYQQHRLRELDTELRDAFKTSLSTLTRPAATIRNAGAAALVSEDVGRLEQQMAKLLLMDVLSDSFVVSSEEFYMLATEAIEEGYKQLYQVLLPTNGSHDQCA